MDVRAALVAISGELGRAGIPHALIGGLALAPYGAARATQDLDLLAHGDWADEVDRIVLALGYRRLHRSADVANYASQDPRKGRVDFLFARRALAHAMLERARSFRVLDGVEVRVVDAEDLIGCKVQASSNDPGRRFADLADIERLLSLAPGLDLDRVRAYFRLFDREKELDELLARRGRR
jgi:hypothetical protein